jgi:hypothetical protein
MNIENESFLDTNVPIGLTRIIQLRFEFEEITKSYNMEVSGSDINSIEWFIENGHRSNSLRNGFNDALNIAKKIKEFYNERRRYQESGLSSGGY